MEGLATTCLGRSEVSALLTAIMSVTSVHLCRESTCAGTLYLGSDLYPLSMPHPAGHTSLAFRLSFAYKPECLPGRGSCRWPFSRPNRRRRHLALLLSDSRRSDMWFK